MPSVLGLPELTNDISVSDMERLPYDLFEPLCLLNGDLYRCLSRQYHLYSSNCEVQMVSSQLLKGIKIIAIRKNPDYILRET